MILDYHPHLPLDRLRVWDLVKRRYAESQASVSGEPLECHPASLRRQGTFKAVRLAPVLFGDRVGRERSAVPRQQQPVKPVHTGTTSCPSVLQHVTKKKEFQLHFPRSNICSSDDGEARKTQMHFVLFCFCLAACVAPALFTPRLPSNIDFQRHIHSVLYYLLPPTACNFSGFQVHTNKMYSYLKQCKTLNATFLLGVGGGSGGGG